MVFIITVLAEIKISQRVFMKTQSQDLDSLFPTRSWIPKHAYPCQSGSWGHRRGTL